MTTKQDQARTGGESGTIQPFEWTKNDLSGWLVDQMAIWKDEMDLREVGSAGREYARGIRNGFASVLENFYEEVA